YVFLGRNLTVAFGKTTLESTEMLGTLDTERRVWLAELYESNFAPVFKTCSSVLRNPDDAADASQEVFLIAAHSMQSGTSRASARAWLQTVARNHCLDVLRRRKRLGRVLVTLSGDGNEGGDVARVAALPMIALSTIAIQTSGGPVTAAGSAGPSRMKPAIQRPVPAFHAEGGASASVAEPSVRGAPVLQSPVPSSPSSTINSAVSGVRQSIDAVTDGHISPPLPGIGVAIPAPSVPATLPTPKLPKTNLP